MKSAHVHVQIRATYLDTCTHIPACVGGKGQQVEKDRGEVLVMKERSKEA